MIAASPPFEPKSSSFEAPASPAPQDEDFFCRLAHASLDLRSDAQHRVSKDAIEESDAAPMGSTEDRAPGRRR
jgi:hypothetical protein